MNKNVLILLLVLLAGSVTFAGELNTISIGADYGYLTSFDEDNPFFIHGPGVAMSSLYNFGSSNVLLYADLSLNFPLSVDTVYGSLDRSDYDTLLAMDATFGLGYIRKPGESSFFSGAGIHFSEILTNIDYVASSLDISLGITAFTGFQIYVTEHMFIESSVKLALTLYNWGKLSSVIGDTGWVGDAVFNVAGLIRVGIGYNFG